ncbi:jg4829, partial [Pararge aegeria aegeria]
MTRAPALPPLARPDLPPAFEDIDKAECMADCLESQCSPSTVSIDRPHVLRVESELATILSTPPDGEPLAPTTCDEVHTIIKGFHSKKAPGPDGITNKTVIGIHKSGKPRDLPSSYRPISLLNTLAKVYERVILHRLKAVVEEKNLLNDEQFGFRAKHSCVHQAHRLTEEIVTNFNRYRHLAPTGAVFFDIVKAFDRVWHAGLLYKLHYLGVPARLVRFLRAFLTDRIFRYRIDGTLSSPRPIRAGVPHGSLLSPLFYALFTSDIPRDLPATVKLAQFADDTA